MSRKPLITQCPICGKIGSCRVFESDNKVYHWESNIINTFFKQSVGLFLMKGDNEKVKFRIHKRRCKSCYGEFTTLEISYLYIEALLKSYNELQQKNEEQLALVERLESQNRNLQKKLNEIQEIASSGTG